MKKYLIEIPTPTIIITTEEIITITIEIATEIGNVTFAKRKDILPEIVGIKIDNKINVLTILIIIIMAIIIRIVTTTIGHLEIAEIAKI